MNNKNNFLTNIKRLSVNAESLSFCDKDLTKFLSFNPLQNYRTVVENNLNYTRSEIFDPDRDFVIRTDRSGFRGYDKVYSYYFNGMRDLKLNIMEIGAEYSYGSLALARYFKNAFIHSVEFRPNLIEFQDEMHYIKTSFPEEYSRMNTLYNFTSMDKRCWETRLSNNKFDIIIDDGSHDPKHQIDTLDAAFPYLKEKGMYFIEDAVDVTYDSTVYEKVKKMKDEKLIKEISIFHHTNPHRKKLLSMNKEQKIKYFLEKGKTKEHIEKRLNEIEASDYCIIAMIKA